MMAGLGGGQRRQVLIERMRLVQREIEGRRQFALGVRRLCHGLLHSRPAPRRKVYRPTLAARNDRHEKTSSAAPPSSSRISGWGSATAKISVATRVAAYAAQLCSVPRISARPLAIVSPTATGASPCSTKGRQPALPERRQMRAV